MKTCSFVSKLRRRYELKGKKEGWKGFEFHNFELTCLLNSECIMTEKKANTDQQYRAVLDRCRNIFEKKTVDYGAAWRILRTSSLTDQIFIKAARIRSLQQKQEAKVEEGIEPEFVGIVNYCYMAMIQLELGIVDEVDVDAERALELYQQKAKETKELMEAKNHDYGEAWRSMRISSMTDLILMKLLRVKQIEDNQGKTLISEGLKANYQDMANYAIFCLIKLQEEDETT